ncbi:MAG: Cys-tRNA(Pro) deacylase [bacterium]|nr:Cys-tRNA(Pro) deacylase [bacterium]
MAKKKAVVTNVMRILNAAKVKYDTVEYEHEGEIGHDFGIEISEQTGIPAEQSFKTLVVRGERQGIMVVCIPVNAEADLKKIAKESGDKKVEMIHVKELQGLTGYIRGGVSPIGMKKKYPTYVDESALKFEKIAVSAGICGATVLLSPDDLQKVTECKYRNIKKLS